MAAVIIFDLSEVLIAGLLGVEVRLGPRLGLAPADALKAFTGMALQEFFCGQLTEEQFLAPLVAAHPGKITLDELKALIRGNFHTRVEGMGAILERLSVGRRLVLLSDHGREWVEYILSIHPWLATFHARHFSFEIGRTKGDPEAFRELLRRLVVAVSQCLFIDDNPVNLAAAETVGIRSVRFHSPAQLQAELMDLGLLGDGVGRPSQPGAEK